MLGINEIKTGKKIVLDKQPFAVLYHEHSKTGRAGAVLRTKIKNLITGAVLERTFQGADRVEEAEVAKAKAQYLYGAGEKFAFMDNVSYEQFELPIAVIGDTKDYLVEGTEVILLMYNHQPINIELPPKVTLTVVEAPPGIKGDTAQGGTKLVRLETGLEVQAPLFIKEGDKLIVNTEMGTYVSRA